jgi:hypothetical protein
MIGFATNVTLATFNILRPETVLETWGWGLKVSIHYSAVGFPALPSIISGKVINGSMTSEMALTFSVTLFFSLLFLRICVLIAAASIQRSWRDKTPSALSLRLREIFCKPMFLLPLYQKLMRHKMERNPIGWLQRRNWSGRVLDWTWLGLLVVVHGALASWQDWDGLQQVHGLLGLGLLLFIAATAAGSFQRERETGLLELVLVSPLKPGQILGGRLRGIWGQFWLATLLWLFIEVYFFKDFLIEALVFFLSCVLTLPIVGLYYSLRRRHFLASLAWTAGMGFFLPAYLAGMYKALDDCDSVLQLLFCGFQLNAVTFVTQMIVTAWLGVLLDRNLEKRKFAMLERRE